MPNPYNYGFQYLGPLGGGSPAKAVRCRVVTNSPQALNVGDPVALRATGYVDLCIVNEANLFGIIVGIGPYFDGVRMTYGNNLPLATTYGAVVDRESTVWVVPAAGNLFSAMCDDAVTAVTRAAYLALIGTNVDHLVAAVPPLNHPRLDISGFTAVASMQWRIMDLSKDVTVDYAAVNVPLIVSGNEVATPPASPLAGI